MLDVKASPTRFIFTRELEKMLMWLELVLCYPYVEKTYGDYIRSLEEEILSLGLEHRDYLETTYCSGLIDDCLELFLSIPSVYRESSFFPGCPDYDHISSQLMERYNEESWMHAAVDRSYQERRQVILRGQPLKLPKEKGNE